MTLPEHQYLDLMRDILETGDLRIDRTGTGTVAKFGTALRFDLSDGSFPVLSTKKIFWKLPIKEMLWFLTGKTNIRDLLIENVRIWTDWPLAKYRKETGHQIEQREFEDKIVADTDFAEKWGDLGPVYGKQWRKWMGPDGKEYDQLGDIIKTLKTNPASRRMLFHGWNVADLDKMALPPCHLLYQFQVTNPAEVNLEALSSNSSLGWSLLGRNSVKEKARVSLMLTQRSVDSALGLPFNLIGAAALLHMVANIVDMDVGELIWSGGDTHVYLDHIEGCLTQLSREPRPFPKLKSLRKVDNIDDFRIEDFVVEGYDPHPIIEFPVAV
ncbi:thymidylate synthase [Rhizobium sp. MHM7A]|uniref:thymidylate synthase n=1 Tax=Rhizobium sp. MHM7A TaxID=2583233 RepID=UPI0011069414|nr:thymidylate synthase [Rhizobium sp. MHM7A]TLX17052.1 thymidylate synthase [Rhizobium sp. MHM7A]